MQHSDRRPKSSSALLRIGGLALLLAAASLVAYRMGWFNYAHTLHHVQQLRESENVGLFVGGFIAVYSAGTAVGLPALPFNVAAGAIFGTVIGGALAWIGSLFGAVIGYWIARTIGHNEVLRWVKRYKRTEAAVDEAQHFLGMLRLRLVPVLPIGMVNFVGGLARAPFAMYLGATAIGVVPSVIIYSYFADSLLETTGPAKQRALVSLSIASVLLILLSLIPKFLPRIFKPEETTRA